MTEKRKGPSTIPVTLKHLPACPDPLTELKNKTPTVWLHPGRAAREHPPASSPRQSFWHLSAEERLAYRQEMLNAAERMQRFAPWFYEEYPDTRAWGGLLESPLRRVAEMQRELERRESFRLPGRLYLKCDGSLPVSGSIKARGGIYTVLSFVEELARRHALIDGTEDYRCFSEARFRELFSKYNFVVGSTGNLGLSIGIAASRLGLNTIVYMSADAKAWKKDLLRKVGATVREIDSDYSAAVEEGRRFAEETADSFFVDDERSEELFWGYSVAALRLQKQLEEQSIPVDREHPLFVYLPCGVGGGPGGIAMGLELLYGSAAHCFFGEPVDAPCTLLGMASGRHEKISVRDIGLQNRTRADGLAVARTSGLVCQKMEKILSGCYTVKDESNFQLLALLEEKEGLFLEPSSLVSIAGPCLLFRGGMGERYLREHGIEAFQSAITHVAWGTGGGMVPEDERALYLAEGRSLARSGQGAF